MINLKRFAVGKWCAVGTALGLTGLMTGCGGSSTSSSSGNAFVRTVNTIYNSGSGTTVSYNGSIIDGTIPGPPPVSYTSYVPLSAGSNSFTFSLSNQPAITFPTVTPSLSNGYYSAFLIGNEASTTKGSPAYPYLDIVSDDRTIPTVGDVRVRFVQTAPDAPNVDIYVNGTLYESNIAYGAATPYSNFAAGALTVSETITGSQTVVSQFSTTLNSPSINSVLLVETQAIPPGYGLSVLADG